MPSSLQLYNSLTRQAETFIPLQAGHVRLYVCGMTVYDFCHIGHARVLVVFDLLQRYLRTRDYQVHYVRNITDIDDKIIQRAAENGETIAELTERFIHAMHEDAKALGVEPPSEEPRATNHIPGMIEMIETLIDQGHAYVAACGDVLYSTLSFANYGKLANQKLDELQAGERVAVDSNKRHPLDFVLWKSAKPQEPAWPSPWGMGRPGWHIECSVMAKSCLGAHFDIHGGGMDLKFPHHECEIAQSEPVCGGKHVNYWLHNGFVQINAEKMAKSLGNFFTIREVLAQFSGEVIRFFILGTHYRSPLNYSDDALKESAAGLCRLYAALQDIPQSAAPTIAELLARHPIFFSALDDDLNTAKAISHLFVLAKQLNKTSDPVEKQSLASDLLALGQILGLLQQDSCAFVQSGGHGTAVKGELSSEAIDQLLIERQQARQNKDFARADAIRDQLAAADIEIEDASGKSSWRRKH